ncbi:ubiquitin c-terminal hydrolase l3 [Moniliophthora roreri]|nr:ubiquitin c-terminal hydrolase l3 [Moniliophthora roreri]
MDAVQHRKYFIPLESNPEVFTDLIQSLGAPGLRFQEVYSLDNEMLGHIGRPVLALVILFPAIGDKYLKDLAEERNNRPPYTGSGESEDVVWFKQTIGNACGLYGILHSLCNGSAKKHIAPGSLLGNLLATCVPLNPNDRALALEASAELEDVHTRAGQAGDTPAPTERDIDVDYHYACFVPSHKNGHLYELDGMKQGPIDTGLVLAEGEDVFSTRALAIIKEFIEGEQTKYGSIGFNLMALTQCAD